MLVGRSPTSASYGGGRSGFTSIPKLVLAMRNCLSSAWADRALSGRQWACLGSTWGTRLSTAVTVMYCFGCGVDLLESKNRRVLDSPEAAGVVQTWKQLLFVRNVQLNVDVDTLLRGDDSQRPPKMCKKCFTAYKTYGRHYQVIDSNMKKALDRLKLVSTQSTSNDLVPSSPKRPRLSVMSRSSLMSSTDITTQSSPDVSVCHALMMLKYVAVFTESTH